MNDNRDGLTRSECIGERIKEERTRGKNRSMTQVMLAGKMYTTQNTISNWERGKATPSMAQLTQLAEIFGCDVSYLLCDYDDRNITDKWISDKTGLSLDAVSWLSSTKESDPQLMLVLNTLFQEDLIRPILTSMYLFSVSQYSTLTEHNSLVDSEVKYSLEDSKSMLKFNAQEMFSLALDRIYTLFSKPATALMEAQIQELKRQIELQKNDLGGDSGGQYQEGI